MLQKKIIDFYFDLFEKGIVPDIYSDIAYSHNKNLVCQSEQVEKKDISNSNDVYLVKYVPEYLTPSPILPFKTIKRFEIKGYAINLEGITGVRQYLEVQLKKKQRSSINSRKNRLERCFDIRYEVYYGHISKEVYSDLMGTLRQFIELRFKQRNETNQKLREWDKYHDLFLTLINNQKASLFAIYENDEPIALSLSYHLDKIFFGAITSYDIDYSKFGLGQILIYKRLEWCINKDYMIYDMSMGNPDYKAKWCNTVYNFEHHIVYRPTSLTASFFAKIMALKMSLKNYLKSKNVHLLYRKIKARFKKKVEIDKELNGRGHRSKYTLEKVTDFQSYEHLKEVDFRKKSFSFLKQSICDFLYSSSEHISNIVILEIEKDKSYLVQGNQHVVKVTFNIY